MARKYINELSLEKAKEILLKNNDIQNEIFESLQDIHMTALNDDIEQIFGNNALNFVNLDEPYGARLIIYPVNDTSKFCEFVENINKDYLSEKDVKKINIEIDLNRYYDYDQSEYDEYIESNIEIFEDMYFEEDNDNILYRQIEKSYK